VTRPITIACDRAELVVECATAAETIGLSVAPRLQAQALTSPPGSASGEPVGIALVEAPSPEALVQLSAAPGNNSRVVLCILAGTASTVNFARDLGLATVTDPAALVGALALAAADRTHAGHATLRGLSEVDRLRLGAAVRPERGGGSLVRGDRGLIAHRGEDGVEVTIGGPGDAAAALAALSGATRSKVRGRSILEGVDPTAVHDVIFGPPRALSDPASKAALTPYGVPLPLEELCTSPSRAAAEAARLGFPVRIGLASPDLRVWDHPDLAVDGVDNAARVRDVFRQMMTLAKTRAPDARLLGVTVTATTTARAFMRLVATPLPERLVQIEVGFADPHGVASGDSTITALPASISQIERVLSRLAGRELILAGGPAERRATVEAIADVLLRVAAFVDDRRDEIDSVEIDPLAVLIGGGAEVREACVTVGDAFLRSLEAGAAG